MAPGPAPHQEVADGGKVLQGIVVAGMGAECSGSCNVALNSVGASLWSKVMPTRSSSCRAAFEEAVEAVQ